MSDPKQYNEDLEDEVEPVIIIDGVEQHDGPSGRVEKDGRFMETILTEPGKRYQTKDGEWHDRRPRHRRLMRKINNDQQKAKFLVLLQAGATPSEAAEAIGSSGTTAYGWRNHDAEFRAAWAAAIKTQEGFEQAITGLDLEKEADRRAIQGVGEPVYFKGEVVGHVGAISTSVFLDVSHWYPATSAQ